MNDERQPLSRPPYILANGRDLRLDVLRGFCVFAMIVDHTGGLSPVSLLTGGNRFLAGAAEGFLMISGLTAGMVYRSVVARSGLSAAVRKALRRALDLYLIAVGLALLIGTVVRIAQMSGIAKLGFGRTPESALSILTLHQTYPPADVILLYALLMAVLPVALFLLARGQTALLVSASVLLWLLHQVNPGMVTFPWHINGSPMFAFAPWQLFFYGSFVVGYHRDRWPRPAPPRLRRLYWLANLAFFALVGIFVLINLSSDILPEQVQRFSPVSDASRAWIKTYLFSKADVRPGRVVAAAVMGLFLLLSLARWWPIVARPATKLLLPFGQHALYAYTTHVFAVIAVALSVALLGLSKANPLHSALFQTVSVGAIWLLSARQLLAPTARTRWCWRLIPVAQACLLQILLS